MLERADQGFSTIHITPKHRMWTSFTDEETFAKIQEADRLVYREGRQDQFHETELTAQDLVMYVRKFFARQDVNTLLTYMSETDSNFKREISGALLALDRPFQKELFSGTRPMEIHVELHNCIRTFRERYLDYTNWVYSY